ncbi:hypothetical protein DL95DRAFT_385018 [Leptodontidium sp. 2 PMI_412]|nr:hypothetical protein DL95DRAFT_385018 [Leptodontidium sp. 2 PMI_412]
MGIWIFRKRAGRDTWTSGIRNWALGTWASLMENIRKAASVAFLSLFYLVVLTKLALLLGFL